MAKLKKYAKAYGINVAGVLEKDEFIERLVAARGPNGCLPPANESYYRKHSIPNHSNSRPRSFFTRAMDAMGGSPSSSQTPPPRQQPQTQYAYAQRPPYQPRQRTTSGPSRFPRPDLDPHPNQQHPNQQQARPANPHHSQYAPPQGYPPHHTQSTRPDHLNVPPSARPRSASASSTPRARSPAPPVEVPSIDELLEMSDEQLSRLSIGTLKEILFKNHVNVRLVVEKGELVARVKTLLDAERAEREWHARAEEEERMQEEDMRRAMEASLRPEQHADPPSTSDGHAETPNAMSGQAQTEPASQEEKQQSGDQQATTSQTPGTSDAAPPAPSTPPKAVASPPPASTLTPKAQAMASRLERTGLCVICQDEEANIAIVDCGYVLLLLLWLRAALTADGSHLALCRGCSDLIMKSTRECPLCRTRIVTESRLLRIFKA
ncbi:hypothetical protein ONZ51_g62 [Trametes cubensis]|uniref:RING-type domain-containing protein n=1 Tax=Trametes cubensis TaxID=1111947 RepID=A0AAD7XG63_9APHY|nr:hypothetical protein ONZ51_g62 [Trametes cubensis]